jgi:Skp family chaperone for outer membrane proteins
VHNTYKREREDKEKKIQQALKEVQSKMVERTKIDYMKIIRGSEKEERNLK